MTVVAGTWRLVVQGEGHPIETKAEISIVAQSKRLFIEFSKNFLLELNVEMLVNAPSTIHINELESYPISVQLKSKNVLSGTVSICLAYPPYSQFAHSEIKGETTTFTLSS